MQVINPFNRTPETDETMAMAILNCHCKCSSGMQDEHDIAWLPLVHNCKCGCDYGPDNRIENETDADEAAYPNT